jgi:hypothetical protein
MRSGSLRRAPGRARLVVVLVLIGVACALGAVKVGASAPDSSSVAVPAAPGTTSVSWTGTIPAANAHPTSDCSDQGTGAGDQHNITVTVPDTGYSNIVAEFTFTITWAPSGATADNNSNDEILTVNAPGGADPGDTTGPEVGSSDGGTSTETVVAHNLAPGTYQVLACGYVNTTAQDYTGTLTVTTTAGSAGGGEASLPSADAQGLSFSAAVPADPQRDEAEPLMEIDRAGNIYTCGPTGFSNASDYAQVSTDGGDEFHLLGTSPRGQQGVGGGGDCALATGVSKNAQGNYQYAYAGLGALTGFTTSTSPDNGHSIGNTGPNGNGLPGATSNGGLADRQWMTFVDDHTVLLSYNQQQPRNVVVQTSTDGGLTYSAVSTIAAPNAEFPGPMRFITPTAAAPQGLVYMPWTKGEEVNLAVSRDHGQTWTDCKVASGDTVKGGTAGFSVADHDSAGNVYVVWADSANYHTWMATLSASKLDSCNEPVAKVAANKDASGNTTGQPTVDPGFTAPVQVDRDAVRTTVFPWVAAGGAPGRVAVAFYGTTSDGDPNTGTFKAAWNVYVSQSLDGGQNFGQVQATTHPFHYDSICLNGLGCDIAQPPGDRSLADFFAIGFNPKDGKLSVVFDRTNKKPDDALGRVASVTVATQDGGPSNGGGTVAGRPVVADSASDPTGDALSNYSLMAVGPPPPPALTRNESAGDFTNLAVSPDPGSHGFNVTMTLASLSPTALNAALTDAPGQSLQWIWHFTNGFTDSAVSASWSPTNGWQFGYDDYTAGGSPCATATSPSGEKCLVYPQAKPVFGRVDVVAGTITLTVPLDYLRQLGPNDDHGRPTETAATAGARFYDGTAFSFVNPVSPTQSQQSFLATLDNTPAFDFTLPASSAASAAPAAGGTAPAGTSAPAAGSSTSGGGGAPSTPAPAVTSAPVAQATGVVVAQKTTAGVLGATKTVVTHVVSARGSVRAAAGTAAAQFVISKTSVRYVDARAHLRFVSTKVTSVVVNGRTATLHGVGTSNGKRGVPFRVTLVSAMPAKIGVVFGRYVRAARVVSGTVSIR